MQSEKNLQISQRNHTLSEDAIDKLTQERIASGELGEDGLGLTKTTQANLDKNDAYIRSLYDPEKDTGFMGGLKKMNRDPYKTKVLFLIHLQHLD